MLQAPAISVLVPSFNYARYLPEAIESVLSQDFKNLEILISDDASTDDSVDVIARYAGADPRIRSHAHKTNIGMVDNWNWCLRNARGELIHFLFGDDKLGRQDALSTLMALLQENPSAVLASSARTLIDENSKTRKTLSYLPSGRHTRPEVIARCINEYTNVIGEPSVVLFRKGAADRLFNPAYKQAVDLDLWLDLMAHGDLAYVDEPLACFRVHEAQQSSLNRKKRTGRRELANLLYTHSQGLQWEKLGFSRKQLLFKQLYEMKKTRRLSPDALLPLAEASRELRPHWYPLLWLPYQLRRNAIKLSRWADRLPAR